MRFAEYDNRGVELEQNENNVDHSMTAATGEMEPVGDDVDEDECSMIYNLPLLFIGGYPSSLENVTASQLEKFITLMLRCAVGHDPSKFSDQPVWWPKNIPYSNPFVRPQKVNFNWLGSLKEIILKCYSYYKSDYLIKFCAHLAKYPHDKLYFRDNWDSTTSLFHKSTGKLLATFRNENMNYDKVVENTRKKLLTQNNINPNAIHKNKKSPQKNHGVDDSPLPACVVQPQLEEVYLCDNCDAEFGDLQRMKSHEKICNGPIETPKERSVSPLSDCEIIEEEELNQSQFMEYFHLATSKVPLARKPPTKSSTISICQDFKTTRSSTRRDRALLQISRCPTIPISSPAGLIMLKKSKTLDESSLLERLERLERNTIAPPLTYSNRPKWLDRTPSYNRWGVTFKPNRDKDKDKENSSFPHINYVHKYSFGGRKPKRKKSLRFSLFNFVCRPVYIRLERLTDEMINDLKLHPWKAKTPRFSNVLLRRQKARRTGKPKLSNHFITINDDDDTNDDNDDTTISCINSSEPIQQDIRTKKPKTILLVDLCSSDEEESTNNNNNNNENKNSSDENRDPRCSNSSVPVRANNNFFINLFLKQKLNESLPEVNNDKLRGNVLTSNDKHTSNTRPVNNILDNRKSLP